MSFCPASLPGVFSGLSVAMGVAWICVISAEMISGDFGLGYRTWQAYTIVDYPNVLVGMLSIGAIGWLTSGCVELVGRRLTRWLSSAAEERVMTATNAVHLRRHQGQRHSPSGTPASLSSTASIST